MRFDVLDGLRVDIGTLHGFPHDFTLPFRDRSAVFGSAEAGVTYGRTADQRE
jgi:hypothetical protein